MRLRDMRKRCFSVKRIDMLTANWFVNPDGRLYNPNPDYDDHKNHNWFDNDITFFQFSLALTFGFGDW